ncbi:MAG: hypothetical protein HYS32_03580 [Candidatus Woesearchaeota archaeon]|nr:MAG: hypothetical protein HYS32_03580 [Candidatus Woesearchaeota archaeon]
MAYFGMMDGVGYGGMFFVGIVYFAALAFVFSIIFWLTHNWFAKGKK